jgi:hypothetical protein
MRASNSHRLKQRSLKMAGTNMKYAMAIAATLFACLSGGCAVVAVTDAVVSVAATTVRVGANVVGGAVDVVRAGVRAVTGGNGQNK